MSKQKVLTAPNFFSLFKVQFLGAFNDNALKNGVLVLVAFSGMSLFGLPESQVVSLSLFLLVLPYFLFSSYAGKFADCYNKVKIVRIIKICELVIMMIIALGLHFHLIWLLMLALFAMGTHSAFFGPIKYSIIPQYVAKNDVVMAVGYIEMGTFIAILIGQVLGSWFVASGYIDSLSILMLSASIIGIYYSYKMNYVPLTEAKAHFYKNFLKDSWLMYKSVTKTTGIRINLHTISWFWAAGAVLTTQLPIVTGHYFAGDGHVFSVILALFSLGIGLGSVICAKLSRGHIIHGYVIVGVIGMAVCTAVLMLLHRSEATQTLSLYKFINTIDGISILILCLLLGIFAGFYSVTCYSELQLLAADTQRSQVISANNILNAIYMVAATVISSIILLFMSVWWLILLLAGCNLLFAYFYAQAIKYR